MPEALAFAWTIARDSALSAAERHAALSAFDQVFGLDLDVEAAAVLTEQQVSLIAAREEARRRRDWQTADRLRTALLAQGVRVRDTAEGPQWEMVGE